MLKLRHEGRVAGVPFLPFAGDRTILVIDQSTIRKMLVLPASVASSHDAFWRFDGPLCVGTPSFGADDASFGGSPQWWNSFAGFEASMSQLCVSVQLPC